jgi:two-component system cell cycle sensor histidine kinase/response regulator CckA
MHASGSPFPTRPSGSAVLLVNGKGLIQAANASAGLLWGEPEGALVGRPLISLFSWDILSSDPDFLEAQWEIVLAGALDQDLTLPAQAKNGQTTNVRLRLESPAGLPADSYFATVQRPTVPVLPPPPSPAAASATGDAHAFRLLADQGNLGFFELDLAAGRVQLSPAWKKQLGFSPEELPDTLEAYRQRVHPDDSAAAPDQVGRKCRPGTRTLNVEFRLRHREGSWIWVHCLGVQWIDDAGVLARVAGVQIDISERKDLEEQLVTNDSRLHDLTDAGPLAAFELDLAHHTAWFSRAWEEMLGYAAGELPAEPASLARALPDQEAEEGLVPWLLGRNPGASSFLESVTLSGKDGRPVPVILGGHRTVSRRGEPQRITGFASALPLNVPAPAATAAAAAAPEARGGDEPPPMCVGAYNTLAEAVILTDPSGRIGFANASAARLLHQPATSLPGKTVADTLPLINRLSQQPSGHPLQRLQASSQPLQLISDDILSVGGGMSGIPVVWTARSVHDSAGRLLGYVIVLRNPEEMTLTPEELVRSNRFESLGLLASGIAHDFNNLLTTILGAISMAKDERDYGALGDAERACDAAKSLTRQLLSFAAGGGGAQVVCETRSLLEDATKIAAGSTTARITLEADEDVAPVLGDRSQLLQIFQNLIINAQQAMPPPPHRPRIDLAARNRHLGDNQIEALPAGDYVALSVTDNASGIRPEHLDRIFDAFFTTKKHGTGLGLATVLSIVRKHGGQITVESQVGTGTTFTVFLPRTNRPVPVAGPRRATLRFGTGRVLFMDDDPQIRTLTGSMLEGLGYKYDLAKDGAEAIALYRRYLNLGRPYDAVIMDITVVGGMGAEECLPELKKLDPDVRAIVASGYDSDAIERKCMELGFLAYLRKPYRVGELGQALKST